MFTTDEIRAALKHATVNLKAMLLLAINGGLGNTDLALLPVTAVDVAGGWLDYPRAKTAIPRRIPLWPETIEAINAVLATRRNPNSQDDQGLLFIGRRGESYRGNHRGYRIHQESRRVFISAKVKGRSFYDLRRTFQTVAEGARDLVAVQSIMGHAPADSDMSAIYRQKVDDDRLRAVTDHVRKWLFGDGSNKAEGGDDHEANEADKLADQMRKQQEEVRSRATPPSEDVRVHGAGRSEGAVRLAR
jgi:integrase